MKKNILYATLCMVVGTSCSGFLDLKPDLKMRVPQTLADCELLLNDYSSMNAGYPTFGEIAADNYSVNTKDWQSLSEMDDRNIYIWSNESVVKVSQWLNPYKTIYRSNQILEIMKSLKLENPVKYRKVLGAAYFFRAFAFHQVTTVFTMPYHPTTASKELGIPLRLSPDLDYLSIRSTLQQTYNQMINDYKLAVSHLPHSEIIKGRPHKAAAFAGLARLYLEMSDFHNAYLYADSSIRLKGELLNYKNLNDKSALPIPRFNIEVLFPATSVISGPLGQAFSRIDAELYRSYTADDLRKKVFFRHNDFDADTYAFKGSYDNTTSGLFVGLTSSEMYLIRAEAAVRIGKYAEALTDLNSLLKNRIDPDSFFAVIESDPEKLLRLILTEREKELLYRGRRWADLRRLNQDNRFKRTLIRKIDGKEYRLEPNSLKYAIKIPESVILETGMLQNKR